MQTHPHRLTALALATALALLVFSGAASADPPARVARLGYTTGAVSFSPAGENDWLRATVNRPLTNGDRLWTDAAARAEIQLGGASVRLSANTSVSVLNLDDRIVQLQMTQGILNLRVRRLAPNQVFEVDTPNLAFTVRQSGDYRIVVDPNQDATDVIVRSGRAQVHGEGAAYSIDAGKPYRFYGTGLRDYQVLGRPAPDMFDRWASERDRRYDKSPSTRFVSPDVVGYQDLDAHGSWRRDRTYGNVWVPNRVASDWTPYRDGHWSWIDPWGWTWVDDAPWGYAVSHYGRWTNMAGTWGWVPGAAKAPVVYAPALVAFIGGSNFKINISSGDSGGVGWFPLAPREIYQPAYQVSRGYVDNVNRGHAVASTPVVNNRVVNNTVVNNTVVNNTYTTTNVTQVVYANRQVPGALVVVPAAAFAQSQPVARAAVRVAPQSVASAPVAVVAAVAPTAVSVRGAAAAGGKPPGRVFERPVVALAAPPAARAGFVAQQQQLADRPGKPLEDAARKALVAAAAAPAPVVKVVVPVAVAAGAVLPAPAASVARPGVASARAEGQTVAAAVPASAPVAAGAAPAASTAGQGQVRGQAVARPVSPAASQAPGRAAVQPEPPRAVAAVGQAVASAPRAAAPAAFPAARSSQAAVPVPAVPEPAQRAANTRPAALPPAVQAAPGGQPVAPSRLPAVPAASSTRPEPAPAARPAEAVPPVAVPKPMPMPVSPPAASASRANAQQPAADPVPARPAPAQRVVPAPTPAPQAVVPPIPPAAVPAAVARPTPPPVPAARSEPAPAARASEPRGPVGAAPAQPPAPQQAGSRAEPRGQRVPRAAASAPGEPRNQGEERRRDEDNRKPKG